MDTVECPTCHGDGVVPANDDGGDPFLDKYCPECGGEEWLDTEEIDE